MRDALYVLVDSGAKSVLVLTIAFLVSRLLRNATASVRHLAWLAAFVVLMALPIGRALVPGRVLISMGSGSQAPQTHRPEPADYSQSAIETAIPSVPSQPNVLAQAPSLGIYRPEPRVEQIQARTPSTRGRSANLMLWAWLTGCVLAAGYWVIGYIAAGRLLRSAEPLDRRGRTNVLRCKVTDPAYPLVIGAVRPSILLPAASAEWPEGRVRSVLQHELGHVTRLDWLSQSFAHWICAVYWLNPFVWYAASRLRAEAEIAADDFVLSHGAAPADYASDLLAVAQSLRPRRRLLTIPGVPAMKSSKIETRLRFILSNTRSHRGATGVELIAAAALAASLLVPLTVFQAGSAAKQPQAATAQKTAPAKGPKVKVRTASKVVHRRTPSRSSRAREEASLERARRAYERALGRYQHDYQKLHPGSQVPSMDPQWKRMYADQSKAALEALKAKQMREAQRLSLSMREQVEQARLAQDRARSEMRDLKLQQEAADQRVQQKLREELLNSKVAKEQEQARSEMQALKIQQELADQRVQQKLREGLLDSKVAKEKATEAARVLMTEKAQIELKDAQVKASRLNLLYNQGSIDTRERDEAALDALKAKIDLQVAQSNLKSGASTSGGEGKEAAALRIQEASAELAAAQAELNRVKALHEQGAIDSTELEKAELKVQMAQIRVKLMSIELHEAQKRQGKIK